MYIDVVFLEQTNTAVKLTMDESGNYYIIVSRYPYKDVRPIGNDATIARIKFAQALEYYRNHTIVF